ncbi:MAG: ABC transporter substrate-binding protein [Chloroflexota bacterium]
MDHRRLDPIRRSVNPVQLDLVESFVQGRVTRRQFIKRATVIGLSMASVSAIIAACGPGTATTAPGTSGPAPTDGASAPPTQGAAGGTIRVAIQRPVSVDPVAMQDLGGYGMTAQAFEFLCTLNSAGDDIAPGLAESWEPNADGTVWTFKLRSGVTWQSGGDFTADDVVASMERLVTANNAGLSGVLPAGGARAVDPLTVEFTLAGANGNFPYLVSVFNAQSLITKADYVAGTTLDQMPDGTGAWKLESYDPATGATFVRNDAWWGGATPLDSVEWTFFDEIGPMVTSYQGGQIDAIVQFDVLSGSALFEDPNFNVTATRTALHRQIWMRTDTGQFADVRVRQALALSMDRDAMVQQLFRGRADVANDHVIAPIYPYFDESVPQRTRNVEQARQLLADAGADGLSAIIHCGQLLEIPDLAVLIQSNARDAGFDLQVAVESLDTFYGAQWCPPEPATPACSGASELGIVDYGHRATPDVYLNAALATGGVWNSSQYSSPEFDAAFKEFQASVGVDAQKAACTKLETILNTDVPIAVPYFYNYLAGASTAFTGVYSSALGQMFVSSTSKVA